MGAKLSVALADIRQQVLIVSKIGAKLSDSGNILKWVHII